MPTSFKKLIFNEYIIFLEIVILLILFVVAFYIPYKLKPAEIGQVIGSQTVLNEKGELVVKYAFISGTISNKISDEVKKAAQEQEAQTVSEEIALRTSSSRTFKTNKPGVKVTEFISGPQYYQDDKGNWWQADYNTTTPEEFSKLPKSPEYARLTDTSRFAFIKRAFATTSTFYPQSGFGGGNVTTDMVMYESNAVWATARNAAAASTEYNEGLFGGELVSGTYYIYRTLMTFDTSIISAGDTITSATLSLYSTTINQQVEAPYPSNPQIVSATPAANNNIVLGDFDQIGSTVFSDSAPTLATFAATAAYHGFALNSSGIANINKGGISKFAVRGTNDLNNTAPSARSYGDFYTADQTGTANDPKLVVVTSANITDIVNGMGTSLAACWELDETSSTRVDAFASNDLTDNNTVTSSAGKQSNAAQFTSANSESLSITDNAALSMADIDFTVAAWVYMDSTSSVVNTIIAKGDLGGGATTEYGVYYHSTLNRFRVLVGNGSTYGVQSADSLGTASTGAWYLVIGWHDATNNTVNIQVNNGAVDTSTYTGGGVDGSGNFRLGWDGDATRYMNGRIDVAAVWKRTLNLGERVALYNAGVGIPCSAASIFKDGVIFKDSVIIEQ